MNLPHRAFGIQQPRGIQILSNPPPGASGNFRQETFPAGLFFNVRAVILLVADLRAALFAYVGLWGSSRAMLRYSASHPYSISAGISRFFVRPAWLPYYLRRGRTLNATETCLFIWHRVLCYAADPHHYLLCLSSDRFIVERYFFYIIYGEKQTFYAIIEIVSTQTHAWKWYVKILI